VLQNYNAQSKCWCKRNKNSRNINRVEIMEKTMKQIKQIWGLAKANPKIAIGIVIAVIAVISLLN